MQGVFTLRRPPQASPPHMQGQGQQEHISSCVTRRFSCATRRHPRLVSQGRCCLAGRHVFLRHKKTCLLAKQKLSVTLGNTFSCATRRYFVLRHKGKFLFRRKEDISSCVPRTNSSCDTRRNLLLCCKRTLLLVTQEIACSCATRRECDLRRKQRFLLIPQEKFYRDTIASPEDMLCLPVSQETFPCCDTRRNRLLCHREKFLRVPRKILS